MQTPPPVLGTTAGAQTRAATPGSAALPRRSRLLEKRGSRGAMDGAAIAARGTEGELTASRPQVLAGKSHGGSASGAAHLTPLATPRGPLL